MREKGRKPMRYSDIFEFCMKRYLAFFIFEGVGLVSVRLAGGQYTLIRDEGINKLNSR